VSELDCGELVELVTDFLDGALDPAGQRRVTEHLALCTGCTSYVEQMRSTIAQLGKLDPGPVEPATRARLLRAFREFPADSV
jgi:anti-sigma factor RsiW